MKPVVPKSSLARAAHRFLPCLILLSGFVANAAFVLPQVQTAKQAAEWREAIAQRAPWLAGGYSYGAYNVANMLDGTPAVVKKIGSMPLFKKLAAQRTEDPITIYVDTLKTVRQVVRAPRKSVVAKWRKEIAQAISRLEAGQDTPLSDALVKAAVVELASASSHDPRALMTGLINSLPGQERGQYFKIGSVDEQLAQLEKNPSFTDQALAASFRANALGLDQAKVSKAYLTDLAREWIGHETSARVLMQAAWYGRDLDQDASQALAADPEKALAKAKGFELDLFNPTPDTQAAQKGFLEKMGQEGGKRAPAFIQKIAKGQLDETFYEQRQENVQVVDATYRIEEASPDIGSTRGFLMRDCSAGAYGYAYSPMEYTFVVYNPQDQPAAFVVATEVMGDGVKTLFVHDISGQQADDGVNVAALHGIYSALGALGFPQMTVAAQNGGYSGQYAQVVNERIGRWKKTVEQKYLDRPIRVAVNQLTGYPYDYDMPDRNSNAAAQVFVPDAGYAKTARVRIEQQVDGEKALLAPKSTSAAILRALKLLAADPESGITAEMRAIEGIQATELTALFQLLKNQKHLPLNEYYTDLKEAFGKFEIGISNGFIKDNDFLFFEGQLNARDAVTTDDPQLARRTVEYTILMLKRFPNPTAAFNLIEENKGFFENNERFVAYLKSFTGRGEGEAGRMEKLMAMGFEFDYLKQDADALFRLVNGRSAIVRNWALQGLQPAQLKTLKPEIVRLVAKDLDEEEPRVVEDASKILLHTNNNDPAVIKELKGSVNLEQDPVIAARSAIALIELGKFGPGSVRRLRQNVRNLALEPESRARAAVLLRALKEVKDPRYCNAMLGSKMEDPDDA